MIAAKSFFEEEEFEQKPPNSKDYFDTSNSSFSHNITNPYPDYLSYTDELGTLQRARFPECIKKTLLHYVIAWDFNNSDFSNTTYRSRLRKYRKIFEKIEKQDLSDFDEAHLLGKISNLIKSLKDKDGKRISDRAAYDLQRPFITSVRKILNTNTLNRRQRKSLTKMLANAPVFVAVPSNARESLSNTHPNYAYTNQQYVDSIRALCFKHMEMCMNIRSRFKNGVPDLYREIKTLIIENPSIVFDKASYITIHFNSDKRKTSDALVMRRILGAIIIGALKLDDHYLIESLFLGVAYKNLNMSFLIKPHGEFWVLNNHVTHEYMRKILSRYIDKEGRLRTTGRLLKKRFSTNRVGSSGKFLLGSRVPMGTLSTVSPLALFMPYGISELDALIGFLASERASSDSIKAFSLRDVCFVNSIGEEVGALATDATGVFFRLYKGRAKKKEQTDIYKRGSTIFKYIKLMVSEYKLAVSDGLIGSYRATKPLDDFFKYDFTPTTGSIFCRGLAQRYGASLLQPIVIKGSHYSSHLVEEIYQPFLDLIRAYSVRSLNPKSNSSWRTLDFIPLSAIRQSRIYCSEAIDLRNYSVSADFNLTYSEEIYKKMEVDAAQHQHLVSTRLNTYYSRSRDKVVIDIKSKFAAQVGDEMLKIAEEMAAFKEGSIELLCLNEAKALCGLSDIVEELSAEEILAQSDTINTTVTDTGFLQSKGITYIIKSPLHACLIQKKIDHIDNEIEKLIINNEHLVPRAISQRILLSIMLLNFDKPMVAEGLKKYAVNKFQFPSLVVSLGGF